MMDEEPKVYQIKIKEKIDKEWSKWFEGFEISYQKNKIGEDLTLITGVVSDQAALNGLLNKIWNLNLTILSVENFTKQ